MHVNYAVRHQADALLRPLGKWAEAAAECSRWGAGSEVWICADGLALVQLPANFNRTVKEEAGTIISAVFFGEELLDRHLPGLSLLALDFTTERIWWVIGEHKILLYQAGIESLPLNEPAGMAAFLIGLSYSEQDVVNTLVARCSISREQAMLIVAKASAHNNPNQ